MIITKDVVHKCLALKWKQSIVTQFHPFPASGSAQVCHMWIGLWYLSCSDTRAYSDKKEDVSHAKHLCTDATRQCIQLHHFTQNPPAVNLHVSSNACCLCHAALLIQECDLKWDWVPILLFSAQQSADDKSMRPQNHRQSKLVILLCCNSSKATCHAARAHHLWLRPLLSLPITF